MRKWFPKPEDSYLPGRLIRRNIWNRGEVETPNGNVWVKLPRSMHYEREIITKLPGDIRALMLPGNKTFDIYLVRKHFIEIAGLIKAYGSTSLMLKPIPEGTLFCGGFPAEVWQIDISDMSKVNTSAPYGEYILAVISDGTYVYCGGMNPRTVWKINPAGMDKVAESVAYGGTGADIHALAHDEEHIYCGGWETKKAWKLNKSDLSKVAESDTFVGHIEAMAHDGTHLYISGWRDLYQFFEVWKIDPTDMSTVGTNYPGIHTYALACDGNYLYRGGGDAGSGYVIDKIDPGTMNTVDSSDNYGGNIRVLVYGGGYLYCAGDVTGKVWKIDPSNMSKVAESIYYGAEMRALTYDGDYIYCGGQATEDMPVWKLDPGDLTHVDEIMFGAIWGLATTKKE